MQNSTSLQSSQKIREGTPIIKTKNNQNSIIQLFLLHSAGGSASNYKSVKLF